MSAQVSAGIVAVLAIVCVVAGFGAGYFWVHPAGTKANGGGGAPPGSSTLSVTAAGTLSTLFPQVGDAVANETPSVQAPIAAQQYQGSLAALAQISQLHQAYDIAAAADFRLIPHLLEPAYASFECVFATTPEALAFDPTVSAFAGINTSNWPEKLIASDQPLAIANASTDPNGYNEIFVLELEGLLQNGSLSALYGHYFTTPIGSLAVPNPSTTRVEPETQAATLIGAHQVAAFIIYQSYAISHHLSYVALAPSVGLGELDSASIATYAKASTSILGTNGTVSVLGAPVAFSVTVPLNAPNATLGDQFLNLLLSPQGAALIAGAGFTPVVPAWSDRPSAVPVPLQPDVVLMPASLSSDLG
ncbi:MAG: substrate-binding domain-containing protein [Thermoplasmata archaeon]|nr:substrate-binding domain-containing protein [Thermoplasmata archaeon]